MISDLLAAIAFLTRLPVGRRWTFGPAQVARAARCFPLVGALLGGLSLAALWVFTRAFPPLVTAILLAGMAALLTGAMHLDGLADTADGFGGGSTREDVLRIMRDHVIGSYGAVAVVLVLALKISTVAALIERHRAVAGLLLAPVLGRWSAALLGATQPYARPTDADGRTTAGGPVKMIGRTEWIVATVTAVAIAIAVDRWRGAGAVLLVAAADGCWAWYCRRRIGGVTGDTLGTAIEISECLVLLLFTALP